MKMTFEASSGMRYVSSDLGRLMTGASESAPRFAVTAECTVAVPMLRAAPMKRRGLVGKRYRQARRAHARERRVWVRAGSPTVERRVTVHLPHAQVTASVQ